MAEGSDGVRSEKAVILAVYNAVKVKGWAAAVKTNKFLNEKVKEKGLTAKEFAEMVEISENYAKVLLAPSSKKLPSNEVGRRIVKALELDAAGEKEFWRLLAEDMKELEEGPAPEPTPEPEPVPCPEAPEIEGMKEELKRIALKLEASEDWIHQVEEVLWKYKEEDRAWGRGIEEKLGEILKALEESGKKQEEAQKRVQKWLWILGIGLVCTGVVSVISAAIVMLEMLR